MQDSLNYWFNRFIYLVIFSFLFFCCCCLQFWAFFGLGHSFFFHVVLMNVMIDSTTDSFKELLLLMANKKSGKTFRALNITERLFSSSLFSFPFLFLFFCGEKCTLVMDRISNWIEYFLLPLSVLFLTALKVDRWIIIQNNME